MRSNACLLPLALAVSSVTAQFVTPPTDLKTAKGYAGINVRYKKVPNGICETREHVKSYSGYSDVAPNEHIFWWFFEAREVDPTEAPLTVWINGGPGSSSMIGLFQELGPCGVDINGSVYDNPYAFNRKSNMLFVDQPTTVGMSYSIPQNGYNDPGTGDFITLPPGPCPDYAAGSCLTASAADETLTANSTAGAAPNMWKTLQGFMGAFPQYSRSYFSFATESYGGHYGPVFNEYFLQQNKKNIPGAHKINLHSVAIGNGWFNPLIQYQAYYNFTVFPGNTYDYKPYNKSVQAKVYNSLYGAGNCVDQIKQCHATKRNDVCSSADNFCANLVELPLDDVANRDEYDIRELMPDRFPYSFYVDYLNSPRVQKAIGAYQNFSEFSNTVGNAFSSTGDDARESMTVEDVRLLLKQGINVMMFFGDADYNCNWLGGQVIADNIAAPGYSSAGFADIHTSDNICHGVVKQAGKYSFVRIYEAGHEVPFYQPVAALAIFERNLAGMDIATGKIKVGPSYKTKGPKESTYREGISTVQFKVLPEDATYNTTTNAPNPSAKKAKKANARKLRHAAKKAAMGRPAR